MDTYDCQIEGCQLYFLPIETRVPLKFGTEVLSSVTCARVRVVVSSRDRKRASGWGETPLSVPWVWPSSLPYSVRHEALCDFAREVATRFVGAATPGHPMEIGARFLDAELEPVRKGFNQHRKEEPLPHLAALVAFSPLDLAIHDAYGRLFGVPTYDTYRPPFLTRDLSHFLEPKEAFHGKYPSDFLRSR